MPNEDNSLNPVNPNQNWQNSWWNIQWQDSDNKILWDYNFDFGFDTDTQTTNNNQWTQNNWNVWNFQQQNNPSTNTSLNWTSSFSSYENTQVNNNTQANIMNTNVWNIDESRSWRFLTPDEEIKKVEPTAQESITSESLMHESWEWLATQQPETPFKTPEEERAEEDAFFENIDLWEPNDTTTNNIDTSEINTITNDNSNISDTSTNTNYVANPETDYTTTNNFTTESSNENTDIQDSNPINNTQNTNNDDWLLQEDKKVEESFGTNTESEWESTQDTNLWWVQNSYQWYTPDENDFSQMSGILNSAETWPINLWDTNQNQQNDTFWDINLNDIISDPVVQNNVESIEITEKDENNKIETEEINLNDIQKNTINENDNENLQGINYNATSNINTNETNNYQTWDLNFDNMRTANENDNNQSTQMNLNNFENSSQNVQIDENSIQPESFNMNEVWNTTDENINLQPWVVNLNNVSSTTQNEQANEAPMEISLDSILINNPETDNNQWNTWAQEEISAQEKDSQTQNTNNTNEWEKTVQVPQKKKKKSWWLRVLIVIAIALGACAIRIVNKMAPDLLMNIKNTNTTNDTSIIWMPSEDNELEWNIWDTILTEDENETEPEVEWINENDDTENDTLNEDNSSSDNTNTWDNNWINENENNSNNEEEPLDPNSIAALLEDDNNTWSNVEVQEINDETPSIIQPENTWDDEFNAFSELDNMLTNNEDLDKLNWYITQWEYFQQRWTENSNTIVSKYWEHIISRAQEELSKLENWEEIDTSIYDELDNTISKLTNLINQ